MSFMYVLPVFLGHISRTALVPSTVCFAGMLFVVGSHTLDHRPHPLVQFRAHDPPCHVRGEGEGPPPHKSQANSNPL